MEHEINSIIDAAIALGITLTNAEINSDLCEAWADRVLQAQHYFDRGEMLQCQLMINSANHYAI